MNKIKIEVLFPEVCNLCGDLQNIEYLRRSLEDEAVVVETSLKDAPYFASNDDISMIYIGTMTERAQELVLKALTPYKARIKELIDKGVCFLCTGNSFEIFGEYIECDDGSRIECMGLLKAHAKRRMLDRYNSLYVGKFEDIDIVGFKSLFTETFSEEKPLFETVKGYGINKTAKEEGIRVNNFLATSVIGPLLIFNPLFTKKLMKLLGSEKESVAYEEAAMDSYNTRLTEFTDPARGISG